jgi:hypothetical protein
MSGYLHRLAARALGEGAAIRPLTRPRFASAAADREETLLGAADAQVSQQEPKRGHEPQRQRSALQTMPRDTAPIRRARTAVEHPAPQSPVQSEPHRPKSVIPPTVEAVPSDGGLKPRASSAVRTAPFGQPPFVGAPEQAAKAHPPHSAGPRSTPVRAITPVVPAPRVAASGLNRNVARREVERAPIPDVHIHIGRVELTALTPASPVVRAAPATKRSGLDDYLRRTERKRS